MTRLAIRPMNITRVLSVALALGSAGLCQAQIHVPTYTGVPLMIAAGVINQQIVQSSIPKAKARDEPAGQRSEPSASRASTVVADQPASYAARLARTYPASQRAEAQRLFEELLAGYRAIEGRFGIPRNDLAGALAAFLAGSTMAYRNEDFPDEQFKPLVEQMRRILGNNADFLRASEVQRREMYEQLAILGMFMATTQMALRKQRDAQLAQKTQAAAKGYLEQFLNTPAERVQITAQGLVLR